MLITRSPLARIQIEFQVRVTLCNGVHRFDGFRRQRGATEIRVDEIPVDLEKIETKPGPVSKVETRVVRPSDLSRLKKSNRKYVLSAFLLGLVIASILWKLLIDNSSSLSEKGVLRLEATPLSHRISSFWGPGITFSPDGKHISYIGWDGEKRCLYLRYLDKLEALSIQVTEDAKLIGDIYNSRSRCLI